MKQDLLQNATLGDPSAPWQTLLRAGAESLRDASIPLAPDPGASAIVFFPSDERETLSLDDADYLLDSGHFRFVAESGKRFPESRVVRLVDSFARDYHKRELTDEQIGNLCGNPGRFLVFVSRDDNRKRCLPPELPYEVLDDEALVRETTRVATGDASPGTRFNALLALRARDPEKGREALTTIWNESEEREPKSRRSARSELLPAALFGLGEDDAPFLERARLDGNFETVQIAIRLLARLPNSPTRARLRELADSVLKPDGSLEPATFSKDLKKFGFPKCEGEELAIRFLAALPSDYWDERFGSAKAFEEIFPFSAKTRALYAARLISIVEFGATPEWFRAVVPIYLASWHKKKVGETIYNLLVLSDLVRFWGWSSSFIKCARIVAPEVAKYCDLEARDRVNNGSRTRDRDFAEFEMRSKYEPTPWSEDFCKAFYRWIFENPTGDRAYVRALSLATNLDMFPRKMRDEIVAEFKARGDKPSGFGYAGRNAEFIANSVNEGEKRFGDYRRNLHPTLLERVVENRFLWIRVWAKNKAKASK
ncbi:MAG: hypothetical protein IJM30_10415 [Thermoguttaceae bacterium]|nr:hypothetical protein [Thermoguttaceae bacterium]